MPVAWDHTFILHQEAHYENQEKLKNQFQFKAPSQESFQLQHVMPLSFDVEILRYHPL
jgi:hypothetical protein